MSLIRLDVTLTTSEHSRRSFPLNHSPVSVRETTTECACEKKISRIASSDGRMRTPSKAKYRSVKVGLKDVILFLHALSFNIQFCNFFVGNNDKHKQCISISNVFIRRLFTLKTSRQNDIHWSSTLSLNHLVLQPWSNPRRALTEQTMSEVIGLQWRVSWLESSWKISWNFW